MDLRGGGARGRISGEAGAQARGRRVRGEEEVCGCRRGGGAHGLGRGREIDEGCHRVSRSDGEMEIGTGEAIGLEPVSKIRIYRNFGSVTANRDEPCCNASPFYFNLRCAKMSVSRIFCNLRRAKMGMSRIFYNLRRVKMGASRIYCNRRRAKMGASRISYN